MTTKQERTFLSTVRGRRAARLLKWVAWHIARGGRLADEEVQAKLDGLLHAWARAYLGHEKKRHDNLIGEAERALLLALEVRETLPIGSEERQKLSEATHRLTGALIREGR